jgi:hypothetical protein
VIYLPGTALTKTAIIAESELLATVFTMTFVLVINVVQNLA